MNEWEGMIVWPLGSSADQGGGEDTRRTWSAGLYELPDASGSGIWTQANPGCFSAQQQMAQKEQPAPQKTMAMAQASAPVHDISSGLSMKEQYARVGFEWSDE